MVFMLFTSINDRNESFLRFLEELTLHRNIFFIRIFSISLRFLEELTVHRNIFFIIIFSISIATILFYDLHMLQGSWQDRMKFVFEAKTLSIFWLDTLAWKRHISIYRLHIMVNLSVTL